MDELEEDFSQPGGHGGGLRGGRGPPPTPLAGAKLPSASPSPMRPSPMRPPKPLAAAPPGSVHSAGGGLRRCTLGSGAVTAEGAQAQGCRELPDDLDSVESNDDDDVVARAAGVILPPRYPGHLPLSMTQAPSAPLPWRAQGTAGAHGCVGEASGAEDDDIVRAPARPMRAAPAAATAPPRQVGSRHASAPAPRQAMRPPSPASHPSSLSSSSEGAAGWRTARVPDVRLPGGSRARRTPPQQLLQQLPPAPAALALSLSLSAAQSPTQARVIYCEHSARATPSEEALVQQPRALPPARPAAAAAGSPPRAHESLDDVLGATASRGGVAGTPQTGDERSWPVAAGRERSRRMRHRRATTGGYESQSRRPPQHPSPSAHGRFWPPSPVPQACSGGGLAAGGQSSDRAAHAGLSRGWCPAG